MAVIQAVLQRSWALPPKSGHLFVLLCGKCQGS